MKYLLHEDAPYPVAAHACPAKRKLKETSEGR